MKKTIAITLLLLCVSSLYSFPVFPESIPPTPQEGDELFVEATDEITYGMLRQATWYKDMFDLFIDYNELVVIYGDRLEEENEILTTKLTKTNNLKKVFIVTTVAVTLVALVEGVLLYAKVQQN